MRAVFACHVVLVAGVDEIIGIGICIHAGFQEAQAMLPYYYRVDVAVYLEEMAFQVACLQLQVGVLIPFRIILRTVHITLSIHDLVVAPVDHRTAGNTDFENIGMRQDQVGRHEAAVAPSVHTDTVGIHVRKRFQVFHAFHLVGHLVDTQVAVDHAFESESPVRCAAVVDRENHVAALCHIDIPASYAVLPAARYQL